VPELEKNMFYSYGTGDFPINTIIKMQNTISGGHFCGAK
jgi:hypothetical protein